VLVILTRKKMRLAYRSPIERRSEDISLGISPWISGVVVLDEGMVQAVRRPGGNQFQGYLVANDAKTQGDHSIGELLENLHALLVRGSVVPSSQDCAHYFGEKKLQLMPVPFTGRGMQLPATERFINLPAIF